MKYLIKLSPEITIKSKAVRKRAISMLKNNIRQHLDYHNLTANISGNWDMIYIEHNKKINTDEEFLTINKKIISILKSIPGIDTFMEIVTFSIEQYTSKNEIFDAIYSKTRDIHLESITWKSFVVRVKRSGLHWFTSTDIERYIWWGLLKDGKNTNVNLHTPDLTIKIEIKDKKFHVIKQHIHGVNGYPIWFQEKVVSLISGGFDSWVSTYSMMKRWCQVDYLFFNLWWTAHELWVKQVAYYLWEKFSIPYKKARFITVPFEEIIEQLLTKVHHKFRGIILKRLMLKVSSMIAENNYYAVIKWDSLGQVSSQTLKNMHVIDKASDSLVLRPLISNNKQEIINVTQQIWTYHFACNMPEYCGIISDRPSTWAKLEDILEEEKQILDLIIRSAYENRKIEFVKNIPRNNEFSQDKDIDVVSQVGPAEIVIDVREDSKREKNHLIIEEEVLNIPFFKINSEFPKLNQQNTYLFYCDKWVLSELHALYLKEKWYANIKVFRPSK